MMMMMMMMDSNLTSLRLFFFLLLSFLISSCFSYDTTFKGIDVQNPVIEVTPSPLVGHLSSHGPKDVLLCERIRVAGHSRFELGSYASSFRVTLAPSAAIPERLHSKIQVCFHRNASLELCQCERDEWKVVQNGIWSSVMSPYEDKYVDVKFLGDLSGSVAVTVEEDYQRWRLLCLALGFVLLLFAPIVSSWVPFYYSSSMAIGVLLVIIVLLFQGMKLVPTGRKNVFYLTLYGSVIGAGSFLLHHFSMLVNAILVNFGLSEEMHNPVSVFLLVGVVLAGAALGYWTVRKFVISEDGHVDVGVAQFVKWAMRIIAMTFIFQSTLDTPLAMGALVSCSGFCHLITSKLQSKAQHSGSKSLTMWKAKNATSQHNRAQFFSKKSKLSPRGTLWSSPESLSTLSDAPVKGSYSKTVVGGTRNPQQEFYSTFHKTPNRKRFSKKEWENFTQESTQQAMAEWASSPEFTDWMMKNADRIKLLPDDDSSDESIGSGSDSTENTGVESGTRFFEW